MNRSDRSHLASRAEFPRDSVRALKYLGVAKKNLQCIKFNRAVEDEISDCTIIALRTDEYFRR